MKQTIIIENIISSTVDEHYGVDAMKKFLRRMHKKDTGQDAEPVRDVTLDQAIVLAKFRRRLDQMDNTLK